MIRHSTINAALMRRPAQIAVSILLVMVSLSIQAKALPLSGQLAIAGPVDKYGVATPGNSRMHFVINGEAAKAMYESLSVKAEKDDCSGFIRKSEGFLNCYAKSIQQEYSCSFALNIRQNKLEANAPTCLH